MNMYSITFKTKQGGSGVQTSNSIENIKSKAMSCFKQKLPATIRKDGVEIGKVFKDNSCRSGWNWIMAD